MSRRPDLRWRRRASGCAEDEVEIPDELRGEPYCVLITSTYGHFADGTRLLIADYTRKAVATACVCSNREKIDSGARDQELLDLALEECQYWASTQDFVYDECLEDDPQLEWLGFIVRAEGEDADYKSPGFNCYGP